MVQCERAAERRRLADSGLDESWNTMKLSVIRLTSAASIIHKDKEDLCLAALLLPWTLWSLQQMVKCECTSHMTSKERQKQSFHLHSAAVSS